jgi:hypothetical protein
MPASAQGINVDFNSVTVTPAPAATYAAAGTAGVWNGVQAIATGVPLVDKLGSPSGVTITTSPTLSANLWFDNLNMTGDDAALMEDIIYGGVTGVFYPITFNGLANGSYDVYTYAIAPDNKTGFITDVDVTESTDGVQAVGGSLFAGHAQGVTYAKHTATVTTGTITVQVRINTSFISVNGIQIEQAGGGNSGASSCDCTGGGNCSTVGGVGRGCPNSGNANGAELIGSGNADSAGGAADTFSLAVTGAALNKPGLILSGTGSLGANPLTTVPNSAGALCVTGMTARGLVVPSDANGNANFPDFQGGQYSASGLVGPAVSITYTYWFRDPGTAAGCVNDNAASDFNFSNGWTVMWL